MKTSITTMAITIMKMSIITIAIIVLFFNSP